MVKTISLSISFVLLFSLGAFAQDAQYFGAKITPKGAQDVSLTPDLTQDTNETLLKLKGRIIQTCEMKGCWMTIDMGDGQEMLVKFKDYGFFVPKTGADGKLAIFEGVAKKEVIDVETLRHYAQDAGKSEKEIKAINKPEEKYTFVAEGVIIEE